MPSRRPVGKEQRIRHGIHVFIAFADTIHRSSSIAGPHHQIAAPCRRTIFSIEDDGQFVGRRPFISTQAGIRGSCESKLEDRHLSRPRASKNKCADTLKFTQQGLCKAPKARRRPSPAGASERKHQKVLFQAPCNFSESASTAALHGCTSWVSSPMRRYAGIYGLPTDSSMRTTSDSTAGCKA